MSALAGTAMSASPSIDDNGSGPKICVGDPGFNGGVSNSTQTSAHPSESGVRTYRGFPLRLGHLSLHGHGRGRRYGLSYQSSDGSFATGAIRRPASALRLPHRSTATRRQGRQRLPESGLPAHEVQSEHELRVKDGRRRILAGTPASMCASTLMPSTTRTTSAPRVWPNFESEIGNGGSINFTLDVPLAGNGQRHGDQFDRAASSAAVPVRPVMPPGTSVTLTATPDAQFGIRRLERRRLRRHRNLHGDDEHRTVRDGAHFDAGSATYRPVHADGDQELVPAPAR